MLIFRYVYSAIFLGSLIYVIAEDQIPLWGKIVLCVFTLGPLIVNEVQIRKTRRLKASIEAHEAKSLPNNVHHDYRETR